MLPTNIKLTSQDDHPGSFSTMKARFWVGFAFSAERASSKSVPDLGSIRFPICTWMNLYTPSMYGIGGTKTTGLKSVHDHRVLFDCFSSASATIHELSWLAALKYLSL
ncbi:hypothetical protein PRUPE_3G153400 [Prunus persica]|uniref:Uncharacterized protein n=1 Tax=Prunus persica TaxID=3760 RepID=A0A251Q1R7_PRUPE|nr:hypothetical protein PRUPE_3G153200 [Prunus persica]ONI17352.1 hypothetical protein PRUPE_3G153400 [Prunus persica]